MKNKDNNKLDTLMETHFADRCEVPANIKHQLRHKLYAAQDKNSARLAWLTVGAIVLFSLMIFIATYFFAGYIYAIVFSFANIIISGAAGTALTITIRKFSAKKEERHDSINY